MSRFERHSFFPHRDVGTLFFLINLHRCEFIQHVGLDLILITPNSFSTTIMENITNDYDRLWCVNINNVQAKLHTFCWFKNQFCFDYYVSLFSHQYRSVFTKLRITAHPLMIEKGRHFHQKIPVDQRICTLCSLNKVEDELHFMLKCTYYADLCTKLFKNISKIYDINSMSDNDIFLLLMVF